jgi:hypothetical protein
MSWARVDDAWWSHRKVIGLDLEARGLWVSGLSYACHQRDPSIPVQALMLMQASPAIADRLVAAGLWKQDENGYRIHDWDDYQSVSAKRSEAGRRGGEKSGKSRSSKQDEEKIEAKVLLREPKVLLDEANEFASTKQAQPNPTQPNPTFAQPETARPPSKPRNAMWDALTEACGWEGKLTKSQQGRLAAAAKELNDIGATPEEVKRRVLHYKIRYPGMDVTPNALAANWASIAQHPQGTGQFAAGSGGIYL